MHEVIYVKSHISKRTENRRKKRKKEKQKVRVLEKSVQVSKVRCPHGCRNPKQFSIYKSFFTLLILILITFFAHVGQMNVFLFPVLSLFYFLLTLYDEWVSGKQKRQTHDDKGAA